MAHRIVVEINPGDDRETDRDYTERRHSGSRCRGSVNIDS
jgi:hypothetical protein